MRLNDFFEKRFCFFVVDSLGSSGEGTEEVDIEDESDENTYLSSSGAFLEFAKFMTTLQAFLDGGVDSVSSFHESDDYKNLDNIEGQIVSTLKSAKKTLVGNKKFEAKIRELESFKGRELSDDDVLSARKLMSELLVAVNAKKRRLKLLDRQFHSGSTGDIVESSGSLKGYRRMNGAVPSAVVSMANQALRSWHRGVVLKYDYNGKRYALVGEIHQHAATDNVSDRLKRPHHGISVFVIDDSSADI